MNKIIELAKVLQLFTISIVVSMCTVWCSKYFIERTNVVEMERTERLRLDNEYQFRQIREKARIEKEMLESGYHKVYDPDPLKWHWEKSFKQQWKEKYPDAREDTD